MAAALQLPTEANVGDDIVIEGTGFEDSTAYTVVVSGLGSFGIKFGGTTSGGGAVDTTNKLTITPNEPGNLEVTVSDGSSTVSGTIQIWEVS